MRSTNALTWCILGSLPLTGAIAIFFISIQNSINPILVHTSLWQRGLYGDTCGWWIRETSQVTLRCLNLCFIVVTTIEYTLIFEVYNRGLEI